MATAPEDFTGRTILGGRFHLLRRLGAGAYGAVYKASESVCGRPFRRVAIKLTHESGLTPERAAHVLADGFTLARVVAGCPDADARKHLIHVYEIGVANELDRRGYVVLEYVPGVPLMDHIQSFGAGTPMATARRYFRELCRVLLACHRLAPPLMHGDLKPDNVLIDECQTLRLIDFGWAKPIDRLLGYAPDAGGCLAYCAPEVLIGRGGLAADIYSLGLIMYEVLCGDGPHRHIPAHAPGEEGGHYYAYKQKMTFPPVASKNRSAAPDPRLFRVVERCCRFHTHDRYESIGQLLHDLDAEEPAPTPERADPTPTPAEVREEWKARAVACLDARDYAGCLDALGAHLNSSDVVARVCGAICHGRLGAWAAAFDLGGVVYEKAKSDPAVREDHKAALLSVLVESARRVAQTDPDYSSYAEYYENQLAGRARR